jgi:hypothetical protein
LYDVAVLSVASHAGTVLGQDGEDIQSFFQQFAIIRLTESGQFEIGYGQVIITFNGLLIALGALGVLHPASTALLHNGSTVITGLKSMTDLLPE